MLPSGSPGWEWRGGEFGVAPLRDAIFPQPEAGRLPPDDGTHKAAAMRANGSWEAADGPRGLRRAETKQARLRADRSLLLPRHGE